MTNNSEARSMDGDTLIVVPARGGSKGVPRKNLRLLSGRPLIHHCLRTALAVGDCTTIVTTEDAEISTVAKQVGAHVIERPDHLSADETTLDDVVVHAVEAAEAVFSRTFAKIVTIQPTSPFVSSDTIQAAINALDDADSALSVCDDRHLRWTEVDGKPVPMFESRLNRQWMEPCWVENGGIIACRRSMIDSGSRIGGEIALLKVDAHEGHDIDTHLDWALAEALVSTPTVAFRVIGNATYGLGHAFRALTLADRLASKPLFITDSTSDLAHDLIASRHHEVVQCNSTDDLVKLLDKYEIDILVNDILDTTKEEIDQLISPTRLIVNFEDMGTGSAVADLTINALYEHANPLPNQRYGWPWVCLREEFLYGNTESHDGLSVLATFGGTDPRNLSSEVIRALAGTDINLTMILGPGNPREQSITELCAEFESSFTSLTILSSVKRMSDYMRAADFAITSNGRTVYELAACGTPMITISQNEREDLHTFSSICDGATNLGWSEEFPTEEFIAVAQRLCSNGDERAQMREELKRYDLESGTERVVAELIRMHRKRVEGR